MKKRIAIIGGGLAGIAAAVRLADAGFEPIVIESSKRLGGRATSLVDPRDGHTIDNCQHVLLGCCTHLIDLLHRLGAADMIEWHRTLYWTRGGGEIDQMRAGWLPAPLHLSGSMRRMRIFDRNEKRHIRRAMWRMIRLGDRGRREWANRTFAEFLHKHDQPPDLIESFWSTIVVSACNLSVHRVSASYAMQVFQDGFLANSWSYSMGVPLVPLAALYDPAIEVIEASGGGVCQSCSAKAIAYDGKRVSGVVTDEGMIDASAVISALPPDRLDKLVSEALRRADRRLQSLGRFEFSPILGVHLRFDQQVMDLPHLIVVGRGVQWIFNKGVDANGLQHLHAVVSGADDWMDLGEEDILRRVIDDVHHALPRSVGLQPVSARSIKEKRATFAVVPGVDAIRPSATASYVGGSGVENLLIAGDWTDTGWPATMESAVRSGYAAAEAISGQPRRVEEVPPSWLARMLGLS